jgi:hypothetical protein
VSGQEHRARVLAIVVTHNSRAHVTDCLRSIRASSWPIDIVVVDNWSSDESARIIEQDFTEVTLIRSHANLGYAGGNNVGLSFAGTSSYEFIFILNPDCTIERECVARLVSALRSAPAVGAVSPVITRRQSGGIWWAGATVDAITGDCQHIQEVRFEPGGAKLIDSAMISGAAFMCRWPAVARTGLMDEQFFLYFEETDWSFRLHANGYSTACLPLHLVVHDVGHGTGHLSDTYQYYMTRNRLLFVRKWGRGVCRALPSCVQASFETLRDAWGRSPRLALYLAGPIGKGYLDYFLGRFGRQRTRYRLWPRKVGGPQGRNERGARHNVL